MKKIFYTLFFILSIKNIYGQKNIKINDEILATCLTSFIESSNEKISVNLLNKIEFIYFLPSEYSLPNLIEYKNDIKMVIVDSKLKSDDLLLKLVLYRQLNKILSTSTNKIDVVLNY